MYIRERIVVLSVVGSVAIGIFIVRGFLWVKRLGISPASSGQSIAGQRTAYSIYMQLVNKLLTY